MITKGIIMGWCRDFECPGGDCGLTCCTGDWRIEVTDNEIKEYENLDHEFRDTILDAIDYDGKTFKCDNGYCNLLNSDGYCNIVLKCGPDKLCRTCRIFPRISKVYGDVVEYALGIACPLVAQRLLEKEPIDFDFGEMEIDKIEPIDYNVYDGLAQIRSSVISVLNLEIGTKELLPGKMFIMFSMYQRALEMLKNGEMNVENAVALSEKYCSENNMLQYFLECSKLGDAIDEKVIVVRNILLNMNCSGILKSLCVKCSKVNPDIRSYLEAVLNNPEELKQDLTDYRNYIDSNFPFFTEKFFTYAWFMDGVTLESDDFEKGLCSRTMEYMLIKVIAMSVYKLKDNVLSEKDLSVVIASVERFIVHSSKTKNALMDMFNEIKAGSIINLLLMI